MLELALPSVRYKESYLAALRELQREGRDHSSADLSYDEIAADFTRYVERLHNYAQGRRLPAKFVPHSYFWLIEDSEYIGAANIRHSLNDRLFTYGGHIGYTIRPNRRGHGYGQKILALALPEAKKLGISRALVTCDIDNMASQKIIEANGGILENIIQTPYNPKRTMRWWIDV